MSTPEKSRSCQHYDCLHYGKVCPESCTIYQDLKAEYLNEVEREDPVEDYIDRGNV